MKLRYIYKHCYTLYITMKRSLDMIKKIADLNKRDRFNNRTGVYLGLCDKRKRSPRIFVCDGKSLKTTLVTKEWEIDSKKIKLEPLVDDIRDKLETVPSDVSTMMGIPFIPQNTEVKIFDKKEFKKTLSERFGKEYNGNAGGFFHHDEEYVFVNFEMDYTGRMYNLDKDTDLELLNQMISDTILKCTWHEIAHLAHYSYDNRLFITSKKLVTTTKEKIDKAEEAAKNMRRVTDVLKGIGTIIWSVKDILKAIREKVLIEGIATWAGENLIEAHYRNSFRTRKYSQKFHGRKPSFIQKIKCVWSDPHSLGYWFVEKVSTLIDANPVKLIIDNPPKNYRELFKPERYVKRMKREGHIQ